MSSPTGTPTQNAAGAADASPDTNPLRVLVAGGAGQVGREMQQMDGCVWLDAGGAPLAASVTALGRAGLDITDADGVAAVLDAHRPDAVVNAAAWTAVDRAEAERDAAFAVNEGGAGILARACAARGVPLVHLSTDYVFSGDAGPYAPDSPTAPLNVYGVSKAGGEAAVRAAGGDAAILRTAWVLSGHSPGFVRTMLRLAAERAPGGAKAGEPLRVVDDQWGHPTPAAAVAQAALQTAARLARGTDAERRAAAGTHHVAGEPFTTWCRLARAIVADAVRDHGIPPVSVEPIPTSSYPTPARRPARVELDLASSRASLGLAPIDWRAAVGEMVREALGGSDASARAGSTDGARDARRLR